MYDYDDEKKVGRPIDDKEAIIAEKLLRKKLQNARFQQRFDIKELARCTGIHPNTISKSERITGNSINLRTFIRMAQALDMDIKLVPKEKDK